MTERAEKLAEEHWKYIEGVLALHGVKSEDVGLIGWHYRTAFLHGYKHGQEDININLNNKA
jgi:hypothetical protein